MFFDKKPIIDGIRDVEESPTGFWSYKTTSCKDPMADWNDTLLTLIEKSDNLTEIQIQRLCNLCDMIDDHRIKRRKALMGEDN